MKTAFMLITAFGLSACQTKIEPPVTSTLVSSASPTVMEEKATNYITPQTVSSSSGVLRDTELKGCFAKIEELRHYNKKAGHSSYNALTKTIKLKTETHASADHISSAALAYATYHYEQNVELICTLVSQKLDKHILNRVIKNSA